MKMSIIWHPSTSFTPQPEKVVGVLASTRDLARNVEPGVQILLLSSCIHIRGATNRQESGVIGQFGAVSTFLEHLQVFFHDVS